MALKFNEATDQMEVVAAPLKRGRKRQARPQESALQPPLHGQEVVPQAMESTGDAWLDAIASITRYLAPNGHNLDQLDVIVFQELQRLGYSASDLEKDPFLHVTTLQHIKDNLEKKRAKYATQIGVHGGTGSIGEYTIHKAGDGRRLHSGDIPSE